MAEELLHTRAATVDDIAQMVELESAPRTRQYLGVVGREFHERALADPDQEQIVAQVGTCVIGFAVLAGLSERAGLSEGGGRVELRRIVVANDHRGGGYGRLLFRAAVSRAYRQHGARQVWLDVKPDNAIALTLYASEGFVRDGTIPDPTDPDGVLLLLVHTPVVATPHGQGAETR